MAPGRNARGHAVVALAALAMAALGCAKVGRTTPGDVTGAAGGAGFDAAPRDTAVATDAGAAEQSPGRDAAPEIHVAPDGATSGNPPDAACATQSASAQSLPLDLFMMVDSSGSMTEKTSAGTTKWAAVQAAMRAFFNDPMSAGISVGLPVLPADPAKRRYHLRVERQLRQLRSVRSLPNLFRDWHDADRPLHREQRLQDGRVVRTARAVPGVRRLVRAARRLLPAGRHVRPVRWLLPRPRSV